MKIKNRFSKRRFSRKDNFGICVMNFLRKIAKKHPESNLYKNLNQEYTLKKYNLSDIDIDIANITIYDILLAENLITKNDKIKFVDLFKKNNIKNIIPSNDLDKISEWVNTKRTAMNGSSWSNLGFINFSNNQLISKYIEYIHVYGITLSSSLSILEIQLNVNDEFQKKISHILKKKVDKIDILYLPNFKSFIHNVKNNFKYMFGTRYDESVTKQILLQDFITELKTEVMKEISKYTSLYFTKHRLIAPSLNSFLTNLHHSDNSREANEIYRALGIRHNNGHISKDGAAALFYDHNYGNFTKDFFVCTLVFNKKIATEYSLGVDSYIHGNIRDLAYTMSMTVFHVLLENVH